MASLSFIDDFQYRVNYAAKCIMNGITSRRRDSCYENNDGDLVVVALVRRARKNAKLWQKIAKDWGGEFPRYWLDIADTYASTPTNKLPELASAMRAKARADFEEWMKRQEKERQDAR